MGEKGGVLTSPWSQTSGLSIAVIHSEYMSHSTYRQVVLSANGPTTASSWPVGPGTALAFPLRLHLALKGQTQTDPLCELRISVPQHVRRTACLAQRRGVLSPADAV